LLFQGASEIGGNLGDAANGSVLGDVLHTTFGHLWIWDLALAGAMLVPVAGLVRRPRLLQVPPRAWVALLLALAAGLCVVAALNGHPRTTAHPALDVASVGVHLFAVAVWVGGLGALVVLAFPVV